MPEESVRSERKRCRGWKREDGTSELVWRAFLYRSGPCCSRLSRPKLRTNPLSAATVDRVDAVLRDVLIT